MFLLGLYPPIQYDNDAIFCWKPQSTQPPCLTYAGKVHNKVQNITSVGEEKDIVSITWYHPLGV